MQNLYTATVIGTNLLFWIMEEERSIRESKSTKKREENKVNTD